MVAYGSFIVLLFLVVASVFTIIFAPMVNQIIEITNDGIEDGEYSTTFVTWFNLIAGLCKAIPIFCLLAITAWAIVRALERRGTEGV